LIALPSGRTRPIAGGRAPVFSPDGSQIAFIGSSHRVLIVPASGGRPRVVPGIRGLHIDWQRRPTPIASGCHPPTGSDTVLSTPQLVLTSRSQQFDRGGGLYETWLLCLQADGRERAMLATLSENGGGDAPTDFVTAGHYVAFVLHSYDHYNDNSYDVEAIDVASNRIVYDVGAVRFARYPSQAAMLSELVLSPDGWTAWIQDDQGLSPSYTDDASVVVHDAGGTRTLDSEASNDIRSPPALANLRLIGDELHWTHDGTERSAPL
jgi:hypothetical protein